MTRSRMDLVTMLVFLTGFSALAGAAPEGQNSPAPSVAPSSQPSPLTVIKPVPYSGERRVSGPIFTPNPQATAQPPISPKDAKKLESEFLKAQRNELKALEHRQKIEMQNLKAEQKNRRNAFEKTEQGKRHQFFVDHPNGPDRRAYIQDFMARRQVMLNIQGDERNERQREQRAAHQALKDDQQVRLQEFQDFLRHGQRPPDRLWPKAGA